MSDPFVHGYGQYFSLLILNSDPETNESFASSALWDPIEMCPRFYRIASESLVWKLVLEAPHPPIFPQDVTDPCTAIREKLPSRNVAALSAGILFKHVGHAFLVLEESLFASPTLERLSKNSSSVCEVAPFNSAKAEALRGVGWQGYQGLFHAPNSSRCWRSEGSGYVICSPEPVLLPCFV